MEWEQALELFALALENWVYHSRFAPGSWWSAPRE